MFKSLVAVACVAIIAVSGVFFMDRHNRIEAERAEAESRAKAEQIVRDERAMSEIRECAPFVRAYDNGDYNKAIKKYGFTQAKPAIESCRNLMWLMGVKP